MKTFENQITKTENDYWHLLKTVLENQKISSNNRRQLEKDYLELNTKRKRCIECLIERR